MRKNIAYLLLLGLLLIGFASGYTSLTGSIYRIDQATAGDSVYCDSAFSNGVGVGIYTKYMGFLTSYIDMMQCQEFHSSQLSVSVNYSNKMYETTDQKNTPVICPMDKPVVCGIKNANAHTDLIDGVYCCGVNDSYINVSSPRLSSIPMSTTQNVDLWCSVDEVMCGVLSSSDEQWRFNGNIYCCKIQNESCSVNEDRDKDGLAACKDPDCFGKIGPQGQICESIETSCNDGLDNDGNGLIDMADPSCFNITANPINSQCPSSNYGPISGPWTLKVFSNLPSWFNPSATNGNDACCGDDDLLNGGFEN